MKRLLDEARRMIRINSVSANGNEELANYIASLLQDRGLKTQLQQVTHSLEDVSKRQFNVIGVVGDPLVDRKIRKGLLLSTHLDTVSPGIPENWTETGGDPFSATIKDGKIYGLGSADGKIDFLCKLHALERFREKKLRMPVYLTGTCGEEIGMVGAKYLIKALSLNPKYVLVGQPTGLSLVHAHKCMAVYRVSIGYQLVERDARGFSRRIDLHAFGRSAHASHPEAGTNAILATFDFMSKALQRGFEMRFTRLDGGDTVNKVPDRSVVQFYLTSHQFEDFKRFFRDTTRTEGHERGFRVELGGVGDAGVRFLPENLFPCVNELVSLFSSLTQELSAEGDDSFKPAHSTVNFGQIRQRAGMLDLSFDLRLLPNLNMEELEARIQKGVQAVAVRYPSLNVVATRARMTPSLAMNQNHELVRICREAMTAAGMEPRFSKESASTEAALYFQSGYEAVVFGPGGSNGNSHSPNEHNFIDQIEKAVDFYEKVIEKVCL
jgi:acetylornithine deacetylase/succinyl-diaminopimelate desuccinylase-like protein